MAKPRKFYESLNQPQWTPNGKHRRTSPTAHRDSGKQPDPSTGGPITFAQWSQACRVSIEFSPIPPTIPYAGIRTGELIGYRAWRVIQEGGNIYLCSLAHHREWLPGEIVQGDINQVIDATPNPFYPPIMGGVYAHFEMEQVLEQTRNEITASYPVKRVKSTLSMTRSLGLLTYGYSTYETIDVFGIAYGTIEMWGEVVEHEFGYRSEFAKVNSIDDAFGKVDLNALRQKYL